MKGFNRGNEKLIETLEDLGGAKFRDVVSKNLGMKHPSRWFLRTNMETAAN